MLEDKKNIDVEDLLFVLKLSFREIILLETLIDMNNCGMARYGEEDNLRVIKEKISSQVSIQYPIK